MGEKNVPKLCKGHQNLGLSIFVKTRKFDLKRAPTIKHKLFKLEPGAGKGRLTGSRADFGAIAKIMIFGSTKDLLKSVLASPKGRHVRHEPYPPSLLIHIGGHLTPPRWNHRYGFATLFGSIFYPFYDITKLYKLPKEQIHISRLG